MEFNSIKDFDEAVTAHAITNLFGGKLDQAVSYIVIMAMAFGAQDAQIIMATQEDNDHDPVRQAVMFNDARLPILMLELDTGTFNTEEQFKGSFLCHGKRPVIGGLNHEMIAGLTREDHKDMLRSEILTGIIQGRPFAQTVLQAAYRVALLHCLQLLDVTIQAFPDSGRETRYAFFMRPKL